MKRFSSPEVSYACILIFVNDVMSDDVNYS